MSDPTAFFSRLSELEKENCWSELDGRLRPFNAVLLAKISNRDLLKQAWSQAQQFGAAAIQRGTPQWENLAEVLDTAELEELKLEFGELYRHLLVLYCDGQIVTACKATLDEGERSGF